MCVRVMCSRCIQGVSNVHMYEVYMTCVLVCMCVTVCMCGLVCTCVWLHKVRYLCEGEGGANTIAVTLHKEQY